MATKVVTTSEVRAALSQINKRFDHGETEPVFFGSHRRAQAALVPIASWEKLLEHADDALDLEVVQQRMTDRRPWLTEDQLDAALRQAAKGAPSRSVGERLPQGSALPRLWNRAANPIVNQAKPPELLGWVSRSTPPGMPGMWPTSAIA